MKAPLVMFEAESRESVLEKARLRIDPEQTQINGREEVIKWWRGISPLEEVRLDGCLCWVGFWNHYRWTAYRYEDILVEAIVFSEVTQ